MDRGDWRGYSLWGCKELDTAVAHGCCDLATTDSYFTLLCYFLLYNTENLLYVFIYLFPLEPPSHHPHPATLGRQRALSWAPAELHQPPPRCILQLPQLSSSSLPSAVYLHTAVYLCQSCSPNPSPHPLPSCVHLSVLLRGLTMAYFPSPLHFLHVWKPMADLLGD